MLTHVLASQVVEVYLKKKHGSGPPFVPFDPRRLPSKGVGAKGALHVDSSCGGSLSMCSGMEKGPKGQMDTQRECSARGAWVGSHR